MKLSRLRFASKFDGFFFSETSDWGFDVCQYCPESPDPLGTHGNCGSCDSHGMLKVGFSQLLSLGCWNILEQAESLRTWETDFSARQPQNYIAPKILQKLLGFFWCEQKSGNSFHERNDPSSLADLRLQVSDRQGQGGLRLSLEHDWGLTNRWFVEVTYFWVLWGGIMCSASWRSYYLFIYLYRLSLI